MSEPLGSPGVFGLLVPYFSPNSTPCAPTGHDQTARVSLDENVLEDVAGAARTRNYEFAPGKRAPVFGSLKPALDGPPI
jgi:hypothetical protein